MKATKLLTNTLVIVTGTITFMIIVIFAVIKIYDLTLNDSKRNHQLQQMEMAKATVNGVNTYLNHIVKDMHLLADFDGIKELELNSIRKNVDHIFNHYDREDVLSIFITDSNANIIHIKGDSLPNWTMPLLKKQINNSQNVNEWNGCWYSQVDPKDNNNHAAGMVFIMVVPILRDLEKTIKSNKKIVGFVSYLISFENLVNLFIEPLELGTNDFSWILDGRGRLIFHPNHKEMLLRNTKTLDSDCRSCHSSFNVQNKMIIGEGSFAEYNIGTEPTKIMAYSSIYLNNEKWIVAISTFLPEVTSNLREKFQLFFILGIFILIAILSYGLSLYYVNSKRIRAEEAQRQSEKTQQLQEQLNQASKLASIGELVDTIAHELNTPAGIIAAHADAILLQLGNPDLFSEELNVIKNQTRRISKYTRSLLSYSKRIPFQPKLVKLNEIIDESTYLLMHRFRANNISVIKNYPDDLPELLLDFGQIEQVFVNILNNAVDAISNSGKIIININVVTNNSSFKNFHTINGLNISISDNGHGIKPDVIDQIFEPFYSSKKPSKGSGLGLSITKAIIMRHGGKIMVSSILNEGTTFKIFLPNNNKEDF